MAFLLFGILRYSLKGCSNIMLSKKKASLNSTCSHNFHQNKTTAYICSYICIESFKLLMLTSSVGGFGSREV